MTDSLTMLLTPTVKFFDFGTINVILGKNGCGKSTALKAIDDIVPSLVGFGGVRYITPERGGFLEHDPRVENELVWGHLKESRRRNQFKDFKPQSMVMFRKLHLLFHTELASRRELRLNLEHNFGIVLKLLNGLLDNLEVRMDQEELKIFQKKTDLEVSPEDISSGESELLTLAIEVLTFEKECKEGVVNLLLLDEPDVHLHPDLQQRLALVLAGVVRRGKFSLFIATHSTAFLAALSHLPETKTAFMKSGQTDLHFQRPSTIIQKIIPIFGAHPLSNIFNQNPVLLLEGDDDVRIWQQAFRSSSGRIKIYPCSADGNGNMREFERESAKILESVYDQAIGYSLRDRDNGEADIEDAAPIKRMKLACRASENLLLTDEVLAVYEFTWRDLKCKFDQWIAGNEDHNRYGDMQEFQRDGFDRLNANLKSVRLIVASILDPSKPWEVAIGQAIAKLDSSSPVTETSLRTFLGPKVCTEILKLA